MKPHVYKAVLILSFNICFAWLQASNYMPSNVCEKSEPTGSVATTVRGLGIGRGGGSIGRGSSPISLSVAPTARYFESAWAEGGGNAYGAPCPPTGDSGAVLVLLVSLEPVPLNI